MKRAMFFVLISVFLVMPAASYAQEPIPGPGPERTAGRGCSWCCHSGPPSGAEEAREVFDQVMESGAADQPQSLRHSRPAWSGEQIQHPVWGFQRD